MKEVKGYSSETDFSDRMQSYITANMLMLSYAALPVEVAVVYPFVKLFQRFAACYRSVSTSKWIPDNFSFLSSFCVLKPKNTQKNLLLLFHNGVKNRSISTKKRNPHFSNAQGIF